MSSLTTPSTTAIAEEAGYPKTMRAANRRVKIYNRAANRIKRKYQRKTLRTFRRLASGEVIRISHRKAKKLATALASGLTADRVMCANSNCGRIRQSNEPWAIAARRGRREKIYTLWCPGCSKRMVKLLEFAWLDEDYPDQVATFILVMAEEHGVAIGEKEAYEHVHGSVKARDWLSAAIANYFHKKQHASG